MIYETHPETVLVAPAPQLNEATIFDNILEEIIEDGAYEAAILSDSDGFAIAAVPFDRLTDMTAAMTALLRDTANQAHQHLKLSTINELSLITDNRRRFICRFFHTSNGQSLTLTVMATADQTYRRITNQAIARIQEACETYYIGK